MQQLIPSGVQPSGRPSVRVLVSVKEVVVRVVVAQYNNQFSALFCRPCLQTIGISFKFAPYHCKSLASIQFQNHSMLNDDITSH